MTNSDRSAPRDRAWIVDDLKYTGLEWGHGNNRKILALHGWMDHADSFRELAPRLTDCNVIALDLSGQGLSGHRSPHATYNIWDDLPQIAGILDQLEWGQCILMGHSRGANISSLFTAAQPRRVSGFIALDSLVPEPTTDSIVTTLGKFVDETRAQQARPPRSFDTKADYIARRQAQGNAPATSQALADRALEQGPQGYQMRGDRRLFASSAVKLKEADVRAVLSAIACPVLNIWASDGIKSKRPIINDLVALARDVVDRYTVDEIPGDHHFHLDPVAAEQIARKITEFLETQAL